MRNVYVKIHFVHSSNNIIKYSIDFQNQIYYLVINQIKTQLQLQLQFICSVLNIRFVLSHHGYIYRLKMFQYII